MEFIYWRHPSVPGIKIEEVSGGEHYSGDTWLEMARQVYCENGRDAYREIGHFRNGAPFLFGESSRISITHCNGLFAVATLPPTPEVDLNEYSDRAALGIDAERTDRNQVLKVRGKFLSDAELAMIPADDVTLNIIAWTIKEAAYKAAMTEGLDLRKEIRIVRMPRLAPAVPVFDPKEFGVNHGQKELPEEFFGEAVIETSAARADSSVESEKNIGGPSTRRTALKVYSYASDDCIVTLCYSPKCAKFGKSAVK